MKPQTKTETTPDGESYVIQYADEAFFVDGILYDPAGAGMHQESLPMIQLKCVAHHRRCGCSYEETTDAYIRVNNAAQLMGSRPSWIKRRESR